MKGGKIPVEILAITKDPEQKTRAFEKCLDVIKGAGVRSSIATTDISFGLGTVLTPSRKGLALYRKIPHRVLLQMNGSVSLEISPKKWKKLILLPLSLRLLSQ